MEGAHCAAQGMNQKALGICFVGNFDETPVPLEQWNKGVIFVASLVNLLDIPTRFIVGHRDYTSKSCPGKLFEVEQFRKAVGCEL
jgi:N-acetyl-anhydromuramyl-L-alanine amidase AmpD